jgi:hypothetical protein
MTYIKTFESVIKNKDLDYLSKFEGIKINNRMEVSSAKKYNL